MTPVALQAQNYKIEDWDIRLDLMSSGVLSPVIKEKDPVLAPPPSPGTSQHEIDLSQALETNRSAKTPLIKAYMASSEQFDISSSLIADGILPPRERADHFWSILDRAYLDVSLLSLKQKKKFARLRPEASLPGFEVHIDASATPSYPSLISANMTLFTQLVGSLTDLCEAENGSYATQMSEARIHGGVSTQADIDGGAELAAWYLKALYDSDLWLTHAGSAGREVQDFYREQGCVVPG